MDDMLNLIHPVIHSGGIYALMLVDLNENCEVHMESMKQVLKTEANIQVL